MVSVPWPKVVLVGPGHLVSLEKIALRKLIDKRRGICMGRAEKVGTQLQNRIKQTKVDIHQKLSEDFN